MGDIKTKELANTRFSTDTVIDLGDRMRRGLMKPADYARNLADDGQVSSTEYASDQLQYAAEDLSYEAVHIAVDTAKGTFRNVRRISNHIQEYRQKDAPNTPSQVKPSRTPKVRPVQKADESVRQTAQSIEKITVKTAQNTVKQSQQAAKASREATQSSIKTAQASSRAAHQVARAAAEASRKAAELLREAAKAAAEAAKVTAKAIAAVAKATAAAIEEFIGFLASGGWVALVIIAVIIIILVIIIAVIGYLDPSIALPE